jgi:hypothetical protein
MWLQENINKTEQDWQDTFKEDEIRYMLSSNYFNSSDYLVTSAIHASIRIILTEKHVAHSTIIANLNDYKNNNIKPVLEPDRNIECIFDELCPHKDEPITFIAWIPNPYSKNNEIRKRTYIVATCEHHTNKCVKDQKYFSDYITKNILPLREKLITK